MSITGIKNVEVNTITVQVELNIVEIALKSIEERQEFPPFIQSLSFSNPEQSIIGPHHLEYHLIKIISI